MPKFLRGVLSHLRWLFVTPWPVWVFVFGVAAAWCGGVLIMALRHDQDAEAAVRYAGWLLDLLGVLAVVCGVGAKLKLHRGRGLIAHIGQRVVEWFEQRPSRRRNLEITPPPASLIVSTHRPHVQIGVAQDESVEEKVDFLVRQQIEASEEIHKISTRQDELEAVVKKQREIGRRDLDAVKEELTQMSEEAAVDGIGLELMGIGWLVLGITFATVPEFFA